jgi:hypothetical protein
MHNGTTQWTPPPHYPRNTPTTNDFHHPERYLHQHQTDDDQPDDDPHDDAG